MNRILRGLVKCFNNGRPSHKVVRPRRWRPQICQLEERVVPTVSFEPMFGGDTRDTSAHNGVALSYTHVNLIFEGTYWSAPTDVTQQDVIDAANHVVNSTFTDQLFQYGSVGKSPVRSIFDDTTFGSNTSFTRTALANVANSFMTLGDVLFPGLTWARPIYFVVTAPNVLNGTTNGGFHDSLTHTETVNGQTYSGSVPYGWLGIDGANRATQLDVFTNVFSHELAEGRTDPYLNTVTYNNQIDANRFFAGAQWGTTNFDEIADFEPDGRRYLYRLSNGSLVEPYWSETPVGSIGHGTFVVDDGNSQVFTLRPQWSISADGLGIDSTFLGNYDLKIDGDQLSSKDDTITVSAITSGIQAGGVQVTENGETVSFDAGKIRNITVSSDSGNDTINVDSLPAGVALTITTGTGANHINVNGAAGSITINSMSPNNVIDIGSGTAGLGGITGQVSIQGAAQTLGISDAATARMTYVMDAAHFACTSLPAGASIAYAGLSIGNLQVLLGNGGNQLTIQGTPQTTSTSDDAIEINTGGGSDSVRVDATASPLTLNLGHGVNQSVGIGDPSSSLDAVHGSIHVVGDGIIYAHISNAASTHSQATNIDATGSKTQTIQRTQFDVDHYDILNTFTFTYNTRGKLTYDAGQAGDGIFVHGTPANTVTVLNGGAGQDVFWVETDSVPCLGPVYANGDPSTGDFAYYYDYLNTTPQTYTLRAAPSDLRFPGTLDQQQVQRTGGAVVSFNRMLELVFYAGRGGGNHTYVKGIPAVEFLNMDVYDGDSVVVGNTSSSLVKGSMAQILGRIDIGYGNHAQIVLDDSGDHAGRTVALHPKVDAYGDYVTGLAANAIYLRAGANSNVTILGGTGDDTFAMDGLNFQSAMRIDGGGGINTLDYSAVAGTAPIKVDLVHGTATGLDGGIAHIQKVTGLPGQSPVHASSIQPERPAAALMRDQAEASFLDGTWTGQTYQAPTEHWLDDLDAAFLYLFSLPDASGTVVGGAGAHGR